MPGLICSCSGRKSRVSRSARVEVGKHAPGCPGSPRAVRRVLCAGSCHASLDAVAHDALIDPSGLDGDCPCSADSDACVLGRGRPDANANARASDCARRDQPDIDGLAHDRADGHACTLTNARPVWRASEPVGLYVLSRIAHHKSAVKLLYVLQVHRQFFGRTRLRDAVFRWHVQQVRRHLRLVLRARWQRSSPLRSITLSAARARQSFMSVRAATAALMRSA